jgi:hypothetical protein
MTDAKRPVVDAALHANTIAENLRRIEAALPLLPLPASEPDAARMEPPRPKSLLARVQARRRTNPAGSVEQPN